MSTNTRNFTEGPIAVQLIKFALPVLMALFLQSLYGAVDLLIVGQFATSADVSGVSTGSQLLLTLTSIVASLSMGLTIILGQKVGEGNIKQGEKVIAAGINLFMIIGIAMLAIILFLAPELALLMNAPEEAYTATVNYLRICGAGMPVIIAYNLIGSIFRGMGDSKTPLKTVAIACVVNIIGDLMLIAGLHMGSTGAAIATVFAQLVSVICSFIIIRKQNLPLKIRKIDIIKSEKQLIGKILYVGSPLALSDMLVSLSFLVILAIVNAYGLEASAGIGVAEKVCAFIMLVASAFMQSMAAFVAQNIGAGKVDRALKALRIGISLSLGCGAVIGLFTFFKGDLLAGIFSNDPLVIANAWDYLKAYAIDCFLTAFLFCFVGFFNGAGMTKFVMVQGIIGAMLVRVPVSYFMSKSEPVSLFKIGLATPCSTIVQIILCFVALGYYINNNKTKYSLPGGRKTNIKVLT